MVRRMKNIDELDNPSEKSIQKSVVELLRKKFPGLRFYKIDNEGKKSFAEHQDKKDQGLSAGVPDLCIPCPRYPYHGLYIEFKRKYDSRVSIKQRDWIGYLQKMGYCAEITFGIDEAIVLIEKYLMSDTNHGFKPILSGVEEGYN